MLDFDLDFWTHYPRKIARAHARKMWHRLTEAEQAAAVAALPHHVRYWKATSRSMDRIPHAGSWLNPDEGRRWEDELEMPQSHDEWWRSAQGIERRAREMGIQPKAGESYADLKARIMERQ